MGGVSYGAARRRGVILRLVKEESGRRNGTFAGALRRYLLAEGHDYSIHNINYDLRVLHKEGVIEEIYPSDFTVGNRQRQIHAYRTI